MSYIEDNLISGEKVVYEGRIHWLLYAIPVAIMIVAIGCIYALFKFVGDTQMVQYISLAIFAYGLYNIAASFIYRRSVELAITNMRIIIKFGFIKRTIIELSHNKVEGINIKQSIAGRIFRFGTITFTGTGTANKEIRNVASPLVFRKKAFEISQEQLYDEGEY